MMNRSFFKVLKIITTLVLFGLFISNSWFIFDYYIMKKMVTSSNMVITTEGTQSIPAIIVCRANPFSDVKKDMSTLKNFLNNSMKLNYMIHAPNGDNLTSDSTSKSTRFSESYIYSFYRGLCVVIKYKTPVK